MRIRMFLYANTELETMAIVEDILSPLSIDIKKDVKVTIEPYWKIKEIYQVDVTIVSYLVVLDRFLKTLANKWKCYGEPIDEILISKKDKTTTIYNEKIEMINIFIDDEKEAFE